MSLGYTVYVYISLCHPDECKGVVKCGFVLPPHFLQGKHVPYK